MFFALHFKGQAWTRALTIIATFRQKKSIVCCVCWNLGTLFFCSVNIVLCKVNSVLCLLKSWHPLSLFTRLRTCCELAASVFAVWLFHAAGAGWQRQGLLHYPLPQPPIASALACHCLHVATKSWESFMESHQCSLDQWMLCRFFRGGIINCWLFERNSGNWQWAATQFATRTGWYGWSTVSATLLQWIRAGCPYSQVLTKSQGWRKRHNWIRRCWNKQRQMFFRCCGLISSCKWGTQLWWKPWGNDKCFYAPSPVSMLHWPVLGLWLHTVLTVGCDCTKFLLNLMKE